MLLMVGMWVWLIILVAELVVGPPVGTERIRVCLEANDFRELINLSLKLQIASRPLFSLVVESIL